MCHGGSLRVCASALVFNHSAARLELHVVVGCTCEVGRGGDKFGGFGKHVNRQYHLHRVALVIVIPRSHLCASIIHAPVAGIGDTRNFKSATLCAVEIETQGQCSGCFIGRSACVEAGVIYIYRGSV